MPNLVIVESPTKAKTIGKFLPKEFVVKSSYGHIRDLPENEMGIDIAHNFRPTYIIPDDKGKIVSALPLPDGRWVVTLQDTAIGQSLYLWSGYSALILLHRGHGLMNGGRDESAPCAAATAALLCVEADANQPPRLVRISLDGTPPDIVDEPNRKGFAYGTRAGHPECGEELFVVQFDETSTAVRIEIIAFSKPGTWWVRLGAPIGRRLQAFVTRRYIRAVRESVDRSRV